MATIYRDFDTNETYTLEELQELYEQYNAEMGYESFDDYMDEMLSQGRQRTGGLIEEEA